MATRFRKTRKFRGSRNHGWGQVGQHRASGHKGGLGQSGMLKHHFSSNTGGELVEKKKKLDQFTSKAEDKVKNAGGELVEKDG